MKYILVIPARMKSSRLPGKPLVDILGKSLIQRTYEQCLKAVPRENIYVATDHEDIRQHCQERSIPVIMTSENCLTGTDRVAEVAEKITADYYLNVQGDEPLINPQDILDVLQAVKQSQEAVFNGYAPIESEEMWRSLSIPKVVFREDGRLLYMSRHPIPGNKTDTFKSAWRQICVYAFPRKALASFVSRTVKTPLEEMEDIEILRFLEMGYEVQMLPLSVDSIAVDHPEDIAKVVEIIQGNEY